MDQIIAYLDPRTIIEFRNNGLQFYPIKLAIWIFLLYATAGTIAWIL